MTTLPPLPPSGAFSLTRSIYTAEDMRAYGAACAAAAAAEEIDRCVAVVSDFPIWIGPEGKREIIAAIRLLKESK